MAKTQLPGLGRAVDYVPDKYDADFIDTPFPTALDIMDENDVSSLDSESMDENKCVRQFASSATLNIIYLCFFFV